MFGNLFTYEDYIVTEKRIIYVDVAIHNEHELNWNRSGSDSTELEAVLDLVNGVLYFGEYDTESQVYNKSPNYKLKIF